MSPRPDSTLADPQQIIADLRRELDECRTERNEALRRETATAEVLFSAASIWEIAIKSGLGRSDFAFDAEEIAQAALDTGFTEIAVRAKAAALVARLPLLHRDPFDRVLVAQAIVEPATLYTADQQLVPYSDLVRRVGSA